MSSPNTPAPLDLAQLEDSNGTPGPWIVESHPVPKYPDLSLHTIIAPQGWQESDGSHKRTAVASELDSLADARLIAAAPALLGECVRQRERIALLEGAIEGLLFDWTNGEDARRVEAEAQALLEDSSNE